MGEGSGRKSGRRQDRHGAHPCAAPPCPLCATHRHLFLLYCQEVVVPQELLNQGGGWRGQLAGGALRAEHARQRRRGGGANPWRSCRGGARDRDQQRKDRPNQQRMGQSRCGQAPWVCGSMEVVGMGTKKNSRLNCPGPPYAPAHPLQRQPAAHPPAASCGAAAPAPAGPGSAPRYPWQRRPP